MSVATDNWAPHSTSGRRRTPWRPWRHARRNLSHAPLEYAFLVIALVWGVAQVFLVPPLQVPDEGDHWFRAWALTEGQLTADQQGELILPGAFAPTADLYSPLVADGKPGLPVSLQGQPGFSSYERLFNGPGSAETVKVASRVASYGPVGYLPQAAGIALGRLVGVAPLTCFYLARLANLLVALALVFFAVRLAPFGKQLFLLLGLLPMTMYELASASCDALTIAGAMFFTALVLWAGGRERLRRMDVALILSAAALLLNVKPGYWALVLLVLLIRPAQLGGRGRYALFVVANPLVVSVVFLATYLLTGTAARADAVASSPSQLQFILGQPLDFLAILGANMQGNLVAWMLEGIGAFGWLTVRMPPAFYLFVLVGGVGFFFRMSETVSLERWRRVVLAGVGVAVFLTIAVALYAFLEPAGSMRVYFQGRYLAPVLLPLLLSVYGIRFAPRRLGVPFVVFVSLVMMLQSVQTLISAYHP